jgi:hypothetical protein
MWHSSYAASADGTQRSSADSAALRRTSVPARLKTSCGACPEPAKGRTTYEEATREPILHVRVAWVLHFKWTGFFEVGELL